MAASKVKFIDAYGGSGDIGILSAFREENNTAEGEEVISVEIYTVGIYRSHFSFSIEEAERFHEYWGKLINEAREKQAEKVSGLERAA